MKAYVMTIDALLAITFIFLAALLIYTQVFQPYAPRGVHLKHLTLDVLTVMEEERALLHAIDGNGTAARQLLQWTPELVCMQVSIIDKNGVGIATIAKEGCGEYGKEFQVAVMPTVHDGEPYMVMAQSWYRKEST